MKEEKIIFFISGELIHLLRRQWKAHSGSLTYILKRRTSIKDILESFGIPHPEIGRLYLAGNEIDFSYIPEGGEEIIVFPFDAELFASLPTKLWPCRYDSVSFLFDDTVRKAGRNLRMLGFDSHFISGVSLREIGILAAKEQRIIVTRNRDLLNCNTVKLGQLLRSENHKKQVAEIMRRFNLSKRKKAFSRCLECNAVLKKVEKKEIDYLLEPLTRKYYHDFKMYDKCTKVYWQGSHYHEMEKVVQWICSK